jgi:hypothetical protein
MAEGVSSGTGKSATTPLEQRPWCECDPEYEGRCTDPCQLAVLAAKPWPGGNEMSSGTGKGGT